MADNILEMRNISKTFPGVKALQQVDLSVERGEVHAICGENGAGKSTLMKVLSGIYPYGGYEGEIVYEGQTARFHGIRDSEKAGIVIIHQELALSPYLSIAENIFLGNERRTGPECHGTALSAPRRRSRLRSLRKGRCRREPSSALTYRLRSHHKWRAPHRAQRTGQPAAVPSHLERSC